MTGKTHIKDLLISDLRKVLVDLQGLMFEAGRLLKRLCKESGSSVQFRDDCELLGLGVRRAYHLISVYELSRRVDIPVAQAERIGWTKLALMSRHIGPENKEAWLAAAERLNVSQLRLCLKANTPMSGPALKTICFDLTPEDEVLLNNALLMAGAQRKCQRVFNRGGALMGIIQVLLDVEKDSHYEVA